MLTAAHGSPIPNWVKVVVSAIALTGAAVCLYSMRQVDPDLYGYLEYGRLFTEGGGLTTHDPFAYTSATFSWTTFEYLAHITLWSAYRYAGPLGLITLKCLLGGVALGGLYIAIRAMTAKPFVWVPTFFLCTSTLSRFFLFRPQLFTFAFFSLFVAVLFRYLLRRRAPLWILPVTMLVWANTHGGFVAGLGAVGLAILLRASENLDSGRWEIRRLFAGTGRLWLTLTACFAVTFINPLGYRLWGYVLTELSHGTNRRFIAEWAPPSLARDPWSTVMLALIGTTLVLVGWLARRAPRTIGPGVLYWVASCVPLITMSCLSVRHIPLAAIWVGPVIALAGSRMNEVSPLGALARRLWFLARGFALVPVCLTFGVVLANPLPEIRADGRVLGRTNPCGAVSFLRQRGVTANVYTPLWWGAYVTWALYPAVHVSMDGRNISLYPDEMVVENMRFFSDQPNNLDLDAPLRYDTDLLLVPSDSPALKPLLVDTRWQSVYRDPDAVLFLRRDARHVLASSLIGPTAPTAALACPTVLQ